MTEGSMWDQRYATHPWPTDPDPLLVEATASLPPGRALDLGCGTGRHAIWLAQQGWTVTGVDSSTVGLRQAGERAAALGVRLTLVEADLRTYRPSPGGYELVVLANIHPDPTERAALFAMAAEGVATGGHLLIFGHHLDDLGRSGPPDPARLYTPERLADELPAQLAVARLERVERPADDGLDVAVIAWLRAAPDGSA